MFYLIQSGESELAVRGRNIIKRLSLICTHLITIIKKSQSNLKNLIRNIPEGHRIVKAMDMLEYRVAELLHLLATLLQFIADREKVVGVIHDEINRLNRDYEDKVYINEFALRRHFEEMQKILQTERGDLALIRDLHKKLADIKTGDFIDIVNMVKGKEELFPREHLDVNEEFVHYMKKLIGAFHQLNKLVMKVEKLEAQEEANFAYLYALLGDKQIAEKHETEIQQTISRLEAEFK